MGKRMHAMATLVERKSRFVMLIALPTGHAADVVAERGGRNGKRLSARTVRYTYTIVRKLLSDAVRKGLIPRNPAETATVPTSRAARAPEAPVWAPAQLGTFLAETSDDYYAPVWWVVGFTGIRRAEACGLRWSDVDLDAGTFTVACTLNQLGTNVFRVGAEI